MVVVHVRFYRDGAWTMVVTPWGTTQARGRKAAITAAKEYCSLALDVEMNEVEVVIDTTH